MKMLTEKMISTKRRKPPARDEVATSLRRIECTARMPNEAAAAVFTPGERAALRKRLTEPVECVYNLAFKRSDAEEKLMTVLPEQAYKPSELMASFAIDPETMMANPLRITAAEEFELFLRFNYCRSRAMQLLKRFAGRRLTITAVRELMKWDREAAATREYIAQANLGLVPAMLKRARTVNSDIGDLIGDGYLALLRAVDRFDCARGFKFSTYACRAILSAFSRVMFVTARDRRHMPAVFDPKLEKVDVVEKRRADREDDALDELRRVIQANTANLNPIEWQILHQRFGFDAREDETGRARMSLAEIAEPLGLTRERVRQIQNAALLKLRGQLEERMPEN